MPITHEQEEIQKMTAIANNDEQKPEVRILAARRLLRKTEFSSRSIRVAKRIAKLFFTNEDVSSDVRAKAASLLEFVLNKPEDDGSPLEELTPVAPVNILQPKPLPPKLSVEELNIGWDHPQLPKKFIEYYEPADLPDFGIPADPGFTWLSYRDGSIREIATASGVYYAYSNEFWFSFDGPRINRVLNPKYIDAYASWQSQYPREPNTVFVEELDWMARVVVARGGYRIPRDMECRGGSVNAPCDMLFVPNVTYEIEKEKAEAGNHRSPQIAATGEETKWVF
jgi:hypothetical protein